MNDPLEILFQELTDTLEDSLPSAYWKHRRLRDRWEDALLETLDQRQLLEDYQESEWDCTEQRERAVFLAAFQLPGPFVRPRPPPFWRSFSPQASLRQASWLLWSFSLRSSWRWRRPFSSRSFSPQAFSLPSLRQTAPPPLPPRPPFCPGRVCGDSPASPPAGSWSRPG